MVLCMQTVIGYGQYSAKLKLYRDSLLEWAYDQYRYSEVMKIVNSGNVRTPGQFDSIRKVYGYECDHKNHDYKWVRIKLRDYVMDWGVTVYPMPKIPRYTENKKIVRKAPRVSGYTEVTMNRPESKKSTKVIIEWYRNGHLDSIKNFERKN